MTVYPSFHVFPERRTIFWHKLTCTSLDDLRPAEQDLYSHWIQPHPLLYDKPATYTRSFLYLSSVLFHVHTYHVNVLPLHCCIITFISTGKVTFVRWYPLHADNLGHGPGFYF